MGFSFGIWTAISTLINVVLGGGLIVTLVTLRQVKKKVTGEADQAAAIADSTELDNVEKAITIWRKMAESLECELTATRVKSEQMAAQLLALNEEVESLRKRNDKMLRLIQTMNHDNFTQIIEQIKFENK